MAHMDRIRMGDIHRVHVIRFQARVRAPDLVLPPRETPRRYASMACPRRTLLVSSCFLLATFFQYHDHRLLARLLASNLLLVVCPNHINC